MYQSVIPICMRIHCNQRHECQISQSIHYDLWPHQEIAKDGQSVHVLHARRQVEWSNRHEVCCYHLEEKFGASVYASLIEHSSACTWMMKGVQIYVSFVIGLVWNTCMAVKIHSFSHKHLLNVTLAEKHDKFCNHHRCQKEIDCVWAFCPIASAMFRASLVLRSSAAAITARRLNRLNANTVESWLYNFLGTAWKCSMSKVSYDWGVSKCFCVQVVVWSGCE